MKLVLVTNYPPDRRPLSEYGYHLAHGLTESNPEGEVVVLSGKHPDLSEGELRVWDYGSVRIPLRILRALKEVDAEGVLFNIHFTNWGGNLANLAGALTPMLAKRKGFRTIALVHHLPQTIDARKAGYRLTPVHRLAIDLACRAIAKSDVVCFILRRDADYFRQHYNSRQVVVMPHGLLGPSYGAPLPTGENVVLTFGNWGRSKNPEPAIRSFLQREITGRLIVAGGSSHTRSDFLGGVRQKYADAGNVIFTGYIPEADIPELFHSAHLVVLPYEENTGTSGVLHQVCQYGRVPVIRDLPVFRQMAEALDLHAYFYDTEEELGDLLQSLLANRSVLARDGMANLQAVQHLRMENVASLYWEILASLETEPVDEREIPSPISALEERSKR